MWVVQYKLFIALGALAIALLISKNKTAIGWALYVFFYPFVLLAKLVYLILKQKSWLLILACANAVISLFRSFRYNFLTGILFLLSSVIAIASHHKYVLILAISALALLLAITYIRAFLMVLRPSNVFGVYKKLTEKLPGYIRESLAKKAKKTELIVGGVTDTQLQAYRTHLQSMVTWNRALLFLSRKLELYLKSGVNVVALLLNLFLLTAMSVLSFAIMSLAVQRIDPTSFTLIGQPSFFLFLYHSLRTFTFGSVSEVSAIATVSRVLVMVEIVFAILTLTLLVTLLFSVKKEKQNQELLETIHDLRGIGEDLEEEMAQQYTITTEQAIEEIGKLEKDSLTLIMWFTQNTR
jgi:hypothetical protein